ILVLLKFITPPVVYLSIPWPESGATEAAGPQPEVVVSAQTADSFVDEDQTVLLATEQSRSELPVSESQAAGLGELPALLTQWQSLLPRVKPPALAIWLLGSACWLGLFAWRVQRFHRLLDAAPSGSARLVAEVKDIARRFGRGSVPEI